MAESIGQMIKSFMHMARLARAGLVLMRHGVHLQPPDGLPAQLKILRALGAPFWWRPGGTSRDKVSRAFTKLGPSYIKLGQFLAARGDLVGERLANDLSGLRDKLPPFPMETARITIEEAFDQPLEKIFDTFSDPIAAASIAQVHKAIVSEKGNDRPLAVKILRPGIEARFERDLSDFYFAAKLIERFSPESRRLRPVKVVDTIAHSVTIEMDLRMEAAAISEMAENIVNDQGFKVPQVDWQRTSKRVLALEWIDGTPMGDLEALKKAGHDLPALGTHLLQSFLRHAMRDGFFHADMHQGNLFVQTDGAIVAVDFGIMGRLGGMEKRFLAEILNGFVHRDYSRAAAVHFEAGYVPPQYSVEEFAQALRAIGEPIQDKPASEVSMGHLLGQLFQYTEVFDMRTRPELILLQKTMVVVEGVARTLNPKLNMWTTGEPVVREWMEKQLGVEGRLLEASEGASTVGKFMGTLPQLLSQAERTSQAFSHMAEHGIRLDDETDAICSASSFNIRKFSICARARN